MRNNRRFCVREHSPVHKPLGDLPDFTAPHKENAGIPSPRHCLKVDICQLVLPVMGRHHMKPSYDSPVGDRNARICRSCRTGTEPRNNLERDPFFRQRHPLFTAPSKDVYIATFKTDHSGVFVRFFYQQSVDLLLFHRVMVIFLSHIDFLTLWFCLFQQKGRNEPVIKDTICLSYGLPPPDCDQTRISRTCSHKIHPASHFSAHCCHRVLRQLYRVLPLDAYCCQPLAGLISI